MKRILLSACLLLSAGLLFAQTQNPVTWSAVSRKTGSGTYEVHLTAGIKPGWHIYSQTTPEGGPISTSISFTTNPLLSLDGGTKEVGKLEKHYEPLFGVDVKQFSDKVDFVQAVKLKATAKTALHAEVKFMVCNDKQCLPPKTIPFDIPLQ
jgi:thiol:disulfide interchange protein DsbD